MRLVSLDQCVLKTATEAGSEAEFFATEAGAAEAAEATEAGPAGSASSEAGKRTETAERSECAAASLRLRAKATE